jgi:lipoprotein-anchoring transpeptidase ErfK/SrfK
VSTVQALNGLREGVFVAAQLPTDGEKLITVSIQNQRLTATQGDTLVANFIVSTGRGRNTRTGTFHILDKIPDAYSDLWGFWMPKWMGIYFAGTLENGFHSLPVLPNGETIWGDALGTPVSYGCVVLGETEAEALYNWAEVGTTVQINP